MTYFSTIPLTLTGIYHLQIFGDTQKIGAPSEFDFFKENATIRVDFPINTMRMKYFWNNELISSHDRLLFDQAFALIETLYEGNQSNGGFPATTRPYLLSHKLWQQYEDIPLSLAGLLHEVLELDKHSLTHDEIYTTYGPIVGFLIESSTAHVRDLHLVKRRFQSSTDKLFFAIEKEPRLLALKCASHELNLSLSTWNNKHSQGYCLEHHLLYSYFEEEMSNAKCIHDIDQAIKAAVKEHKTQSFSTLAKHLVRLAFEKLNPHLERILHTYPADILWRVDNFEHINPLITFKCISTQIHIESMHTYGWRKFALVSIRPETERSIQSKTWRIPQKKD